MYNLILSNLYKGIKSKTLRVLLLVSTCCAAATVLLANGIAKGTVSTDLRSIIFLFSDTSMLAILGAVLAAALIGSEFDTRLFHHSIVAGYSRFQIVVGKAITYWIFAVLIMSPYFIANVAALVFKVNVNMGVASAGFLNIINTGTDDRAGKIILALLCMLLIYVAQLTLTILFAFVAKKAMLIIPVFYVISAMAGQASLYAESLPNLGRLLNATPFGNDFIGLTSHASNELVVQAITVSVLFMVVIVAITYAAFRKTELK
ncbi:hypothetical protein PSTEL_22270 [Paenibacillus stellifer]|uniref:Uncharacterized protein n=1 Tax=Paenibacillus stellifer TaxID=169760 RepID=A0A089LVA1_9BACL|nr:ABC transporter permease [Paenibacillus stellifer]AIQ65431.1 hypothetical protein PSTEL_22270 [Paenibacillus stellifer]